jgi:serine/threonine protein kinase
MIGQTINNYILERKLGEGGMGAVYFARHNCIERVVAIKVLHQNLFNQTNIRNRFKNEANALIKLGHPNIVKIYDYIEQDNIACLIMEYIEGFTLDEYIMKVTGPLPAAKATRIINSVLDAVQCAHDKNIFHRDIKPGNIMVSKDGKTAKIMDFGIAKFTDASSLKTTHANAQLGTPFYMSPEQVKGLTYNALSDIYSLGVTLFEMVTGKCPYQEITNLFELQSKIVNEPLPSTGQYYPDVTLTLQEAIKIATNKIPEQRFKSCDEFKNYLLESENQPPALVHKQTLTKQSQQPVIREPNQGTQKPQHLKYPAFFVKKKNNNKWVYWLVILLILILAGVTFSSLNQPNLRLIPSKTSTPLSIKKGITLGISRQPGTSIDSEKAGIKQGLRTTETTVIMDSRGPKRLRGGNLHLPPVPKQKPSLSATLQKVEDDLINHLKNQQSFGGIPYDNISEINITSVGNKVYYGDSSITSYDVNLTISGQPRKCQVVYTSDIPQKFNSIN